MRYVVYVKHPNNKAIIHTVECGRFVHSRRDETHNGYWSIAERDPFETLKDATEYAHITNKRIIDKCAFCMRHRE